MNVYWTPYYNIYPVTLTFSSSFNNFTYAESVNESSLYLNGLGIITDVTDLSQLRPKFWTHIEDKNTRYQAYNILRYGTNSGDNVYRFTRNGVDYSDKIKTALTLASNEDIVGVIQLPMADRLNT